MHKCKEGKHHNWYTNKSYKPGTIYSKLPIIWQGIETNPVTQEHSIRICTLFGSVLIHFASLVHTTNIPLKHKIQSAKKETTSSSLNRSCDPDQTIEHLCASDESPFISLSEYVHFLSVWW